LVGHYDEEAFGGVFVGLKLIVRGVYTCAACEQKEKFGRRVRVIGGFRDVYIDVGEFGQFLQDVRGVITLRYG
jgi:hypothetical protein